MAIKEIVGAGRCYECRFAASSVGGYLTVREAARKVIVHAEMTGHRIGFDIDPITKGNEK